jgi:hypothetical protein
MAYGFDRDLIDDQKITRITDDLQPVYDRADDNLSFILASLLSIASVIVHACPKPDILLECCQRELVKMVDDLKDEKASSLEYVETAGSA